VGEGDGDGVDLRPGDQLLVRAKARARKALGEPRQALRIDVRAARQARLRQRLRRPSVRARNPSGADDADVDGWSVDDATSVRTE
jgi:hypothetical protein